MKRWVLVLSIFIISACGQSTPHQPPVESMETTDRLVIEDNTDVLIPKSAKELHGYLEGFRETTFYVRFSIEPEEQDSLLASSVCETSLMSSDYPWTQSDYLDFLGWWTPENAKTYIWCSGEKDHEHQIIFLDMHKSEDVAQ